MAAGLMIAGCAAGGAGSPVRPSPALRLVAYDGCADLLSGLRKAAAAHVGPFGLAGDPMMSALPAGRVPGDAAPMVPGDATARGDETSHSVTNVQEPGVDEPDLVKNDGRRIVTVSGGRLRVIDMATRKETGSLDVSPVPGSAAGKLLLSGDRVLVIMQPTMIFPRHDIVDTPGTRPPAVRTSGPRVVLVDIAGTPRVVSSMELDGAFVDAREVGSVARLVFRSTPHIDFPQPRPGATDDATARNRKIVERAPADAWLPRYSVTRDGTTRQEKVPCDQVSHPASYTGTSLISVLSVDLAGNMTGAGTQPVSVVAGGETVYASGTSLYVTDRPSPVPVPPTSRARPAESLDRTDIYRFDIGGSGRPRFAASGSVPGYLINQYAMSEYAGNLRVATTTGQIWTGGKPGGAPPVTESAVYVLGRHGARLDRIGEVGGLGRGERVYAVRFIGSAGYVVTFRQTDPLYTLDLRDPAHPRTTGELKISGYSAYLHPAGDGRLIGVGQAADGKGRTTGAQVSLFDVTNPAAPRKIGGYSLASAYSLAELDPHAFLYWPASGLTVLPTIGRGGVDVLVLKVTSSGVRWRGALTQPADAGGVQRAILAGGTLWTLSPTGLQANDATTLARTAWIPFT